MPVKRAARYLAAGWLGLCVNKGWDLFFDFILRSVNLSFENWRVLAGLILQVRARRLAASRLFIYLAPVRDPRHIDGSGRVVNDVNYPVVTDTNPPFVIAVLEFFAARRPGSRR
jgi:hypothetical protein